MSKTIMKIKVEPPKQRNPFAIDAMVRRATRMHDRRAERGGAKNWRHEMERE